MLVWQNIGEQLINIAQSSKKNAVIIAPFIKQVILRRILDALSFEVQTTCITRWRVEELMCGVSDLEVYSELKKRENSNLFLVNDLHAKYYRFDDTVIIGSFNLTNAALGYNPISNIELSYIVQEGEATSAFEKFVFENSVPVSSHMYDSMKNILKSMPESSDVDNKNINQSFIVQGFNEIKSWNTWLPTCRSPEFLYNVYMGDESKLSQSALLDAKRDLHQLSPSVGLTRTQFIGFISGTISMSPIVDKLAKFAIVPRRFGEMKRKVGELVSNSSPANDWQTLMRWLLYFSPERFTVRVENFSEIFTAKW